MRVSGQEQQIFLPDLPSCGPSAGAGAAAGAAGFAAPIAMRWHKVLTVTVDVRCRFAQGTQGKKPRDVVDVLEVDPQRPMASMADKEPVTAEYSGAATGGSATETTGAVLKQYDNDSSIEFYRRVMGGGTLAIHYGVYGTPGTHTSVAVARYQKLMCDTLDTLVLAWRPQAKILDLGSGAGGPAHAFAARFAEASLTCCNICPEQNQVNMGVAGELGLASRMECFSYDFNQPMPAEWAGKYDAVYSVEAFCHASDKEALIKQVYTMLKPGGVLMFSDIMMSDEASEEDVINFTKTNAGKVAKPKDYIEMCGPLFSKRPRRPPVLRF